MCSVEGNVGSGIYVFKIFKVLIYHTPSQSFYERKTVDISMSFILFTKNHFTDGVFKAAVCLTVCTFFMAGLTQAQSQEPASKKEALKTPMEPEMGPHVLKKPRKNATQVEEKLRALDNLYVPIHWADSVTGLAIAGYDPIAYFEFNTATLGDEEFELVWHGVSWRFMNKGNLDAFKRSPSLYAPRFAGYDAYAVSQGVLSEGRPSVWAIMDGRLHLFHTPVNLHLWREERQKLRSKAQENWENLSLDLPRFKVGQ